MAAATSNSSRGALVTWVVILAILFVVSTVLAFYANAERVKSVKDLDEYRNKYIPQIITDQQLQGNEVALLKEARKDPNLNLTEKTPVLTVAIEQRKQLARAITGRDDEPGPTADLATQTLLAAADELKKANISDAMPTDNLVNAVTVLANLVTARETRIKTLTADLLAANNRATSFEGQITAANAAYEEAVAAAQEKATKDLDAANSDVEATRGLVAAIKQATQGELTKSNQSMASLAELVRTGDQKVKELDKLVKSLQFRLNELRTPTQGPIMQQPDGRIVRVPGTDVVFINLGAGDQIAPGLTFEIFDKIDGMPTWKGGDDERNDREFAGKASIEVTRVGATSSEARIIKVRPGESLSEGDLIANLVYDPNAKYNFVVHGDFDLDNNGKANPNDGEVVKRLVTQWGSRLQDGVTVDTDFLVLGKEPVIPIVSAEDGDDPLIQAKIQEAQEALDRYSDIRAKAKELNIPILNQNRFLYFVGYFDLARR